MRGASPGVLIAFAAIYAIWGSTYLAIGVAVKEVPPVFMVAVRGLFAGGALYLWARMRGAKSVDARELLRMGPTAALLFGGGYVLVGWAEQYVASGAAALLNATTPAWVVLIEWLTGRRDRPAPGFMLAVLGGVAGVGLLVSGDGATTGAIPLLPALALVGASVAWAAGTVRARQNANGDPVRDAAVQLLTGAALLFPVSALLGEGDAVMRGLSWTSLYALGYLIALGSLAGYTAYVWLLHHVSASKVASHSYVNPLIAVVLGAAIGGEAVGWRTVAAAVLIVVSVVFIVTEKKRAAVPVSAAPQELPRAA